MKYSLIIFIFFFVFSFGQVDNTESKKDDNYFMKKSFVHEKMNFSDTQTVLISRRKIDHPILKEETESLIIRAYQEGGNFWIDEKGDTIIATPYWRVLRKKISSN